jgi:ABC-2 type transport system permease protein
VLIYGIVMIWLFGREFTDHTVKDLLALPTPRTTVVAAKFILAALWCLLLATEIYLLGLLIGTALHLPGWSAQVALHALGRLLGTAAMTIALVVPMGLAASIGRGYLAAVGALFATVFSAQVIAILGYGAYYPWSVPALYSGAAGPDQSNVGPLSYGMVTAVGAAAVGATIAWWRRADQSTA